MRTVKAKLRFLRNGVVEEWHGNEKYRVVGMIKRAPAGFGWDSYFACEDGDKLVYDSVMYLSEAKDLIRSAWSTYK